LRSDRGHRHDTDAHTQPAGNDTAPPTRWRPDKPVKTATYPITKHRPRAPPRGSPRRRGRELRHPTASVNWRLTMARAHLADPTWGSATLATGDVDPWACLQEGVACIFDPGLRPGPPGVHALNLDLEPTAARRHQRWPVHQQGRDSARAAAVLSSAGAGASARLVSRAQRSHRPPRQSGTRVRPSAACHPSNRACDHTPVAQSLGVVLASQHSRRYAAPERGFLASAGIGTKESSGAVRTGATTSRKRSGGRDRRKAHGRPARGARSAQQPHRRTPYPARSPRPGGCGLAPPMHGLVKHKRARPSRSTQSI
jgi:hypothetical protein